MRSPFEPARMSTRHALALLALIANGCDATQGDPAAAELPTAPQEPLPTSPTSPTSPNQPEVTGDSDGDGTVDSRDCAPFDASLYRTVEVYADADGDGRTVGDKFMACLGLELAGVSAFASDTADCDDSHPDRTDNMLAFDDSDLDGRGTGEAREVCAGSELPAGFALTDGDCDPADGSRFTVLSYEGRDADGDGYIVAQAGTVCGGDDLPSGYSWYGSDDDCNDTDARLHSSAELYVDADGDHVGAGESVVLCLGWEGAQGYSSLDGDCAPDDATRERELPYDYRDADGDGRAVRASGTVCSAEQLPPGYLTVYNLDPDCDDQDPAAFATVDVYADADGDGVGAGAPSVLCNDGMPPPDAIVTSNDCAPGDASKWMWHQYTHVDVDGDGATAPKSDWLCAGATLPLPYLAEASGRDCDDEDSDVTRFVVLYPDRDGDGLGAWPYQVFCVGPHELPEGYSRFGDDLDDQDPTIGDEEDEA